METDRGSREFDRQTEGDSGGELTPTSEGALQRHTDEPAESDDERVDRLQRNIVDSRRRVHESLTRLQDEVGEALDVHEWIDEHPWETVGAAFAVGFFFGFR